jgi:hypothetical protein
MQAQSHTHISTSYFHPASNNQLSYPNPTQLTMQPSELTLIVAATRNMGIGAQGGMPWKGLRKEMQYFARVTTRLPPQVSVRSLVHLIRDSYNTPAT